MVKTSALVALMAGTFFGADLCSAKEMTLPSDRASPGDVQASGTSAPSIGEGMIMVDYEIIPLPGNKSIDLMGFHFLNRMNDWLYLGIGGYAPLVKGEYGGFMALDVTAHAQRKLFGNVFGAAGVSLGGGGGGKSVAQSVTLSGTGGFAKTYVGIGYDFGDFSLGINVAKMKFLKSIIDHSQFNVYAQIPFSYAIGSYADAGTRRVPVPGQDRKVAADDDSENVLTSGFDNYRQIRPEGLNKGTINVIDLQFSHFVTKRSYWYLNAGVGYHGLPLYNQVLAGVGYRFPISENVRVQAQVGLGSGGYAPETINTGPGLLVFPKLSAEYALDPNFGLSLAAGYLWAPKGSSKNYTLGASLNYHLGAAQSPSGLGSVSDSAVYRGYRVSLFQQTEFHVTDRDIARGNINLISVQLDSSVNDHLYIPVQVSVASNAYLGYPGYGELMGGLGVQSRYQRDGRLQMFGQLLAGANSHGLIFKPGAGLTFTLSDQLALYGVAGLTFAPRKGEFKSDYVGLGLSYRFSVPGR